MNEMTFFHAVKMSKVAIDRGQSHEQRQCWVGLGNGRVEGIWQAIPLWGWVNNYREDEKGMLGGEGMKKEKKMVSQREILFYL